MKCTPQKAITSASVARGLLREAERVADVVGHVLDLGQLVVVGEDHGVALARRARAPRPAGRGCLVRARMRGSWEVHGSGSRRQGEVEGGGRVRERTHRDEVYARSGRDRPRSSRASRRRCASSSRAARRRAPRRAHLRRASCCRAAAAARRPRAPRRSPRASRHLDLERQVRPRRRARAAPPPPRRPPAPTWFSLIRIASKSPTRWLTPPPAATAAFSSRRSPGVVLRVSRIARAACRATASHVARGQRRDAGQAREEVQRRALGGQQRRAPRPRRAAPARRSRHSPSGAEPLEARVGVERAEDAPRRRRARRSRPAAFCVIVARARAPGGTVASRGQRRRRRRPRPARGGRAARAR